MKEIREYLKYHIQDETELELAVAFVMVLCNTHNEHYVVACNKVVQKLPKLVKLASQVCQIVNEKE